MKKIENALREYLEDINLKGEDFKDTPRRFCEVLGEFMKGNIDVSKILNPTFPSEYGGLVTLSDIKVYTLCPHHLLPVTLKISFSYLPGNRVVGLSKIIRFLKEIAKQPIKQEDLTKLIVDEFSKELECRGCFCIIKANHLCMEMRGIEKHADIITSALNGEFLENVNLKKEVLKLLKC